MVQHLHIPILLARPWTAAGFSLNLRSFSPTYSVYTTYRESVTMFVRRRARRTLLYEQTAYRTWRSTDKVERDALG